MKDAFERAAFRPPDAMQMLLELGGLPQIRSAGWHGRTTGGFPNHLIPAHAFSNRRASIGALACIPHQPRRICGTAGTESPPPPPPPAPAHEFDARCNRQLAVRARGRIAFPASRTSRSVRERAPGNGIVFPNAKQSALGQSGLWHALHALHALCRAQHALCAMHCQAHHALGHAPPARRAPAPRASLCLIADPPLQQRQAS
jgi:hypothetical protein